ncbi:FtsB family cell division protein [Pectinatus brassicae]|uniref:Cell division protein DivIC n=1 Tax=Pectinatus brassicae TaxID=862415 RepID=A0A840UMG4_9FIRM|nr:septum formation initiator family protein [Pectinatus brassicae]MBB5335442.1 cell division protein DivIC [Pectinatus brassicae]
MKKRQLNIFTVVFIAIIAYFSYIAINQQMYISNVSSEYQIAQQKYDKVMQENQKLKAEKDALQNPKYIEKIARDELGMTKKGEIPYVASDK